MDRTERMKPLTATPRIAASGFQSKNFAIDLGALFSLDMYRRVDLGIDAGGARVCDRKEAATVAEANGLAVKARRMERIEGSEEERR